MPHPDDAAIGDLLHARRHAEAFEMLVGTYQDKVYRLACSMLGDDAQAEDCSQQAFLKAWRGLPGFRRQSSLSTWLYAITRNTCLNAIEMRRRTVPLASAEAVATRTPEPGDALDIRALVARLPENYRQVVTLFHMEEKSYEEVATMLNLPIGTVRTHLHRARKELAKALLASGAGAR